MTTHTTKINKFAIFGLGALGLGFVTYLISALPDEAPTWIGALSWIMTAIGMGLALIGFSKSFGALRTGIVTFTAGIILTGAAYVVFKPLYERVTFVGGRVLEPNEFWALTEISSGMLGLLCLAIGGLLTVITYLSRLLVAVETTARLSK